MQLSFFCVLTAHLHSSSVVDVFAAYSEIVQFIAELEWPEKEHQNMCLELVRNIMRMLV